MLINNQEFSILKTVEALASGWCSESYHLVKNTKNNMLSLAYGSRHSFNLIDTAILIDDIKELEEDAIAVTQAVLDIYEKQVFTKTEQVKLRHREIVIQGEKFNVLKEFNVYYSCWECDGTGYVVQKENSDEIFIAMTNHGSYYLSDQKEIKEFLHSYYVKKNELLDLIKEVSQ